ncbi:translation elongation factor Ts [Candidatus Berkelbacteria bacterium]|nr:translation elongation factor Ts [Candidatus Berkelbacteria bacterium]
MAISADDVKRLREATGVGVMDAKKALDEANGDVAKATEILRASGAAKAAKKADRAAGEGIIASYIHNNKQIGVLVELSCETDFVARTDEFQALAQELAMHIAAADPSSTDELLAQQFVRDESQTIEQLIQAAIQKIGENIQIARYARFAIKGGPSCSLNLTKE